MEEDVEKGKDHSIIIAALIFVILTAAFIVVIIKQIALGQFTLPFYLILAGMYLFATSLETEGIFGELISSLGWTLNMLGLTLFYQYGTENPENWIYIWPLIFPLGPGLGQLLYGAVKARRDPFERGKVLALIGMGIFVLVLTLFKLFFNNST
jgi:hypothetical protein